MSDITLITPPDKIHSQEISFLLIHPGDIVKEQFNVLVAQYTQPFHVYLYDPKTIETEEPEWLLDVFNMVDFVVLDLDNCPPQVRTLGSYFISKDKTYWLTNGGESYYNLLSRNRIYNLEFMSGAIGGKIEKKQQQG